MRTFHRYVGLALSLIVLLISITGVMLVWKREYLWVTIPEARELRAPDIELAQVVEQIDNSYQKNEVIFVRFYAEGLSVHKVYLTGRRYAWHSQAGAKVQQWQGNDRFEDWLLDLHHRLLLGNKIGLNVVGLGGLLLLLLMGIGLRLWWPWRKSYRANFMPLNGRVGSIRKSHFETGVGIIVPASLMVITGVILVYPTESRFLLRDSFRAPYEPVVNVLDTRLLPSTLDWKAAFTIAGDQFPDGEVHWVSFPKEGANTFSLGIQEQESWNRMGNSSIVFSDASDVKIKYQAQQLMSEQALGYVYPLHAGKFPTLYRVFMSGVGVMLAWLCFLGLVAFFKRRR